MSTWPSIWIEIETLEVSGRLLAVRPRSTRDVIKRPMYLLPDLHNAINASYPDAKDKDRYNSLWADLERFVTGQPITDAYLRPLRPYRNRVWEIRSKMPRPSIRVFGLFASRDVFIGTSHQVRNVLTRPEWTEAIRFARFQWRQLFGETEAQLGQLHELVTGATYVRRESKSN